MNGCVIHTYGLLTVIIMSERNMIAYSSWPWLESYRSACSGTPRRLDAEIYAIAHNDGYACGPLRRLDHAP